MLDNRDVWKRDGTVRFTNHSDCQGSKSGHFSRDGKTNIGFATFLTRRSATITSARSIIDEAGFSYLSSHRMQLVIKDRERKSKY